MNLYETEVSILICQYHAARYSAAFQCMVNSAIGHFHQYLLYRFFVVLWIYKIRHSKHFPFKQNHKVCTNLCTY